MRHCALFLILLLASAPAHAADVEDTLKVLTKHIDSLAKEVAALRVTITETKQAQEKLDWTQNKDISATANNVNTLDKILHRTTEKLKKIDEIAADVNGLKQDLTELKTAYKTVIERLVAIEKSRAGAKN
ncbi:MAG TPA: hypothetical protein VEK08_22605 [Planctomycetota bacterium]|nr:hypothetical protein [Planctomycetota bacterium]